MDHVSHKALCEHLWAQGQLSYKLDSLQVSISDSVERASSSTKQICILSSRQIGKSFWALVFALEYLIRNPGSIVRVIAPTEDKAHEIIEDNLLPILADAPAGFVTSLVSQKRWYLANGSSLRMGALERRYVNKNRGGNASVIIYEECGFVTSDDFTYARDSVLGPQLLRSNGLEIFVSSPSEDPEHALHNVIMPACEALGTLYRYTIYDSPSLSQMQINQAIERSGGEDSEAFQREYMAMIVRSKGLMVIPRINQAQAFVGSELPPTYLWHRLCITCDWGGVRDKTVWLLHWHEPNTDIYYFLDEIMFEPNITTDVIAAPVVEWIERYRITAGNIWADVHGQTRIDLYKNLGLDVKIPPKNDWLSAVNTMQAKFAMNKVRVHERCEFLKKSILGGTFNPTRTDFARNAALGHMDGCAALMYALRTSTLAENKNMSNHLDEGLIEMAEGFKTFGNFRKIDPNKEARFKRIMDL